MIQNISRDESTKHLNDIKKMLENTESKVSSSKKEREKLRTERDEIIAVQEQLKNKRKEHDNLNTATEESQKIVDAMNTLLSGIFPELLSMSHNKWKARIEKLGKQLG